MAFTHYKTKGICLKKQEKGEADFLLMVFTEEFGRIEVLAKGVRKISSKLKYGTELFCLIDIEFIQGKGYKTLTDVIVLDKFKSIKSAPANFDVAEKIASVMNALCLKEEKDDQVWRLLIEIFQRLSNYQLLTTNYQLTYQLAYYFFLWNLFSILGYAPELYNCVYCKKKLLPENLYFCSEQGGIICSGCSKSINYKTGRSAKFVIFAVSVNVVKMLRVFIQKDWGFVKKIKIDKNCENQLQKISNLYQVTIGQT
jgi:DNA repair protein RecO (recombination protein O)